MPEEMIARLLFHSQLIHVNQNVNLIMVNNMYSTDFLFFAPFDYYDHYYEH